MTASTPSGTGGGASPVGRTSSERPTTVTVATAPRIAPTTIPSSHAPPPTTATTAITATSATATATIEFRRAGVDELDIEIYSAASRVDAEP